jgi:hypothetical protein
MSDAGEEVHGQLIELTSEECWQLLASGAVGRIAWVTLGRPIVIPVNFTVEGTTIYIHTSPYSAMVREIDDSQVAFQVDNIDAGSRSGWTVVAQGRAELRYPDAMNPRTPAVDVWPAGTKGATVAIDVDGISGRRLTPGTR